MRPISRGIGPPTSCSRRSSRGRNTPSSDWHDWVRRCIPCRCSSRPTARLPTPRSRKCSAPPSCSRRGTIRRTPLPVSTCRTPAMGPSPRRPCPIWAIIAHDVDGDGNLDLIVAGNVYDAEPNTARADAGNGLWLKGDGHGHFTPVPAVESGLLASHDVTGLALVKTPAGNAVFVVNHGDSLQAFRIRRP